MYSPKGPCGCIPARQGRQAALPPLGSSSGERGLRTDLKALWDSIVDCDCIARGTYCSDRCAAFGAIGEFLATLARKCPVCGGPCEITAACPEHE